MSDEATQTGIEHMLDDILREAELTRSYVGKSRLSPRVLDALRRVPRDQFVPIETREHSYENRPLCIGHGQTISQPYIVALMTDLLQPLPAHRVLEIGTGSGYQTAVLAHLVDRVYSVEIVAPLAEEARQHIAACGLDNVEIRCGDGNQGWPEHAPYNGIIVTAAARHIPPMLLAQLSPGGRMVIPIGAPHQVQSLLLLEKDASGAVQRRNVLPVAFVPLIGDDRIANE